MGYFGLGTERVEEAVRARFPKARVRRMDRDAVRSAKSFNEILGAVRRGEVDVLIGTQMVAKGHDFPKMTLVASSLRTWGFTCPISGPGRDVPATHPGGGPRRAGGPAGEVFVQTSARALRDYLRPGTRLRRVL